MKKKVLILALVCAVTCAFALTACGDDGEEKKTHSQQQWETAFDAALGQEQAYTFEEGDYFTGEYSQTYRIDVKKDAQNSKYYYQPSMGAEGSLNSGYDWLMKKGDKYYAQYNWQYNFGIELDAYTYASKEEQLIKEKSKVYYVSSILEQLRTLYSDFKQSGVHGGLNSKGNATEYELKNATLSLGEIEVRAERVSVAIYDDTDKLGFVTLDHVKSTGENATIINNKYTYSDFYIGVTDPLYFVILPEIKDKTFKMADYELDLSLFDSDPQKHDGYQEALSRLFSPNYNNKTATFHADGTITGDMAFGDVAISMYTWSGDINNVTVTNANNPNVAESDKFTLTGALETSENGHCLVLHLNVPMGGDDIVPVTFYYTYAS